MTEENDLAFSNPPRPQPRSLSQPCTPATGFTGPSKSPAWVGNGISGRGDVDKMEDRLVCPCGSVGSLGWCEHPSYFVSHIPGRASSAIQLPAALGRTIPSI